MKTKIHSFGWILCLPDHWTKFYPRWRRNFEIISTVFSILTATLRQRRNSTQPDFSTEKGDLQPLAGDKSMIRVWRLTLRNNFFLDSFWSWHRGLFLRLTYSWLDPTNWLNSVWRLNNRGNLSLWNVLGIFLIAQLTFKKEDIWGEI